MKSPPTFELLRERRQLPVINPARGTRFTISLRDWHGALWAVRVIPDIPDESDKFNQFVKTHVLMSRSRIEELLEGLRLVQTRRPRSPGKLSRQMRKQECS